MVVVDGMQGATAATRCFAFRPDGDPVGPENAPIAAIIRVPSLACGITCRASGAASTLSTDHFSRSGSPAATNSTRSAAAAIR